MTPIQEQQLVTAAVEGDQRALTDLLQANQVRVYNVCLRMVANRDDAAEIAQETMLKVIEHIDRFAGRSSLSTWIIRIAMNLSLSHLRKRKVRQSRSMEDTIGDDQTSSLRQELRDTREPAPDHRVQQNEMLAQLHQALEQIDDDLRAVLVLRDIDEMDYQHISEVLSLPLGTVKSRLFRARLALRQRMAALSPALAPVMESQGKAER